MAKKQILSLVAASLVAAAFVGCGSSSSSKTPLTVTVSDAYVYGATVTKGGTAFDTMDGAKYTWNDAPSGDLVSTGGANDLNGNGADSQDPLAVAMKAPSGYKNINPLTTLEANGMTLDAINTKYGIALETTDVDVVTADLAVYKAAAQAALELAVNQSGSTTTGGGTTTDDGNATTGDTNAGGTPDVAPSRPGAIVFRATLPGRPGGSIPATDGNTTDGNTTDGNTSTGNGNIDISAEVAAINAATDVNGVNAAVRARMVALMGTYTPPATTEPETNTTGDINDTNMTGGTGTDCLPGEDCTPDDNATTGDDNATMGEDNATMGDDNTTMSGQSTPSRPE